MPPKAPQVCLTPGCAELVPTGYCDTCKPPDKRQRHGEPWSTEAWHRTRRRYLTRHPTCEQCNQPAIDVDHVIPRRILVAAGIHNPDHPRWLQALCHPHHSHKTATVDKPLLARLDAGADPRTLTDLG